MVKSSNIYQGWKGETGLEYMDNIYTITRLIHPLGNTGLVNVPKHELILIKY